MSHGTREIIILIRKALGVIRNKERVLAVMIQIMFSAVTVVFESDRREELTASTVTIAGGGNPETRRAV